jgi:aminoglycoside 6'-N-acetyltransferase I
MKIRPATETDKPSWLAMRQALWPHALPEKHTHDMNQYLSSTDRYICVAEDLSGDLVGFAELSTRCDYVEGCESSPVAYLEGLYVRDSHRGQGIAKSLITAAERWAKGQGLHELASDTDLDNKASIQMHARLGFHEANRNVHFVKKI